MAGSLYCFICDTWNGSGPIVGKTICGCFDNETDALDWYHANLATNGGKCYNVELGSPWVTPGAEWGDDPGAFCGDGIFCWKIVCTGGTEFPYLGTINEALAYAASLGIENGCVAQVADSLLYCAPSDTTSAGIPGGGGVWICLGKLQIIGGKAVICSTTPLPSPDPCTAFCTDGAGPREWVVNISSDLIVIDDPIDHTHGCDFTDYPFFDGAYGLTPYLYDDVGGLTRQCTWAYIEPATTFSIPGCAGWGRGRAMYLSLSHQDITGTGPVVATLRIQYGMSDSGGSLQQLMVVDLVSAPLADPPPADCGAFDIATVDWTLIGSTIYGVFTAHYGGASTLTAQAVA